MAPRFVRTPLRCFGIAIGVLPCLASTRPLFAAAPPFRNTLLAVGWMFYRQRDFFGMAVVLFWLGTALVHVGVYMADARAQTLNLVSMGYGEPMHDWYYLLARGGLLRQDHLLGGTVRAAGMLSMAVSLAWGAWMVKLMRDAGRRGGGGAQ